MHPHQKLDVDTAVEVIVSNPFAGEAKRGDLAGVDMYRFKSQSQLVLLNCESDPKTSHLVMPGS
ncbi:MAG: type II toxin-antitoxin system RelE/ParE family toxin [Rhodoferax sp.]|nr:type II toxin-antitoxin system RelE/ParE family toxin [Rhodoferax sp.]